MWEVTGDGVEYEYAVLIVDGENLKLSDLEYELDAYGDDGYHIISTTALDMQMKGDVVSGLVVIMERAVSDEPSGG